MEFKEQYLTYDEYKSLGGTLGKMPFNLLELKARQIVNERTQNRLKDADYIPQEVKVCLYHIINLLETFSTSTKNTAVSSENTDGYSVSYKSGIDLTKEQKAQCEDTMLTDLYGVIVDNESILYLGVSDSYYKGGISTC